MKVHLVLDLHFAGDMWEVLHACEVAFIGTPRVVVVIGVPVGRVQIPVDRLVDTKPCDISGEVYRVFRVVVVGPDFDISNRLFTCPALNIDFELDILVLVGIAELEMIIPKLVDVEVDFHRSIGNVTMFAA